MRSKEYEYRGRAKGLTVNVDLDGVLYDFEAACREWGEIRLDKKLPVTDTWSMWEPWGISKREWYEIFHDGIRAEHIFRMGHEEPYALWGMLTLRAMGFRVRIVTAKRLVYRDTTLRAKISCLRWLDEKEIPFDEIAFTSDKQGYNADVVIDDKPTMAWAQDGAFNILMGQPWNLEFTNDLVDEFERRQIVADEANVLNVVRTGTKRGWVPVIKEIERWLDQNE
jgi:5'(3')-deoxyribonucleotidase